VQSANPKAPGLASPNILSPELTEAIVAQGSFKLENTSDLTSFYGYDNDGPMVPVPGDLPSATHKVEATKTEPDKNTYLILQNQHGADPNYTTGPISFIKGMSSVMVARDTSRASIWTPMGPTASPCLLPQT
jgi:hypothetical protein